MRTGTRFRPDLLAPLVEILKLDGYRAEVRLRGASMSPSLLPGDILWLSPPDAKPTPFGSIVIWLGRSGPVTHRVVGMWRQNGEWRLLTKGDALSRLDPPTRRDRIVAQVVARARNGRILRLDAGWPMLTRGIRAVISLAVGLAGEFWDRASRGFSR